jgi:cell division septation protein DedD
MSRPDMKTHITPKQAAVLFIPFMILILLASCNRTPVAAEEAATENAHGPEVELTPNKPRPSPSAPAHWSTATCAAPSR